MKQFKRDQTQNSNKLHLDKYYTSDEVAQYCIDVARKVLKGKAITEVVEPSAGNGVFSKKIKNCIAYDIEPEDESVIQQDFLKLDIPYKEGRLFIGNPPFGDRFNIGRQFVKRCINLGDYVAFILPISQYKNNYLFSGSWLLHSEDLKEQEYTDRNIHCCFNVYQKMDSKNKNEYQLRQVKLVEQIKNKNPKRNRPYLDHDYDFRICSWGASAGRILNNNEHYAKEIAFYIDKEYKNIIKNLFMNNSVVEFYHMTSTPNLVLWQVYNYIKENISEIE